MSSGASSSHAPYRASGWVRKVASYVRLLRRQAARAIAIKATLPLPPDELYHAFDPDDWLFGHNLRIGGGRIVANSYGRNTGTLPEGILSPYEAFMAEREKEEAFEWVRAAKFANRPPRLGSIFLFPDKHTADTANEAWWGGRRILLPARVLTARRVGVFDSRKLDAERDAWLGAARDYWGGVHTENPLLEVLLEGVIRLSGWEPYGRFGPAPPDGHDT